MDHDRTIPDTHVIFTGKTDIWWLKWLKHGFRHCFVLFADPVTRHWVIFDPMANQSEIRVLGQTADIDLPAWFAVQGCIICPAIRTPHDDPAPIGWLSCVSQIKKFLGIRNRFIWTPYQLYRHLTKMNNAQ
jgi:hypothetical protein